MHGSLGQSPTGRSPRPRPLAGSGLVVASRRPSNQNAPTQRKRVALWGAGLQATLVTKAMASGRPPRPRGGLGVSPAGGARPEVRPRRTGVPSRLPGPCSRCSLPWRSLRRDRCPNAHFTDADTGPECCQRVTQPARSTAKANTRLSVCSTNLYRDPTTTVVRFSG